MWQYENVFLTFFTHWVIIKQTGFNGGIWVLIISISGRFFGGGGADPIFTLRITDWNRDEFGMKHDFRGYKLSVKLWDRNIYLHYLILL